MADNLTQLERDMIKQVMSTSENEPEHPIFTYIWSEGTLYKKYKNRKVKSVNFNVGRFGQVKHRLEFPNSIRVSEAFEHIENYLREPLNDEYEHLAEIIEEKDCLNPKTINLYKIRGQIISSAIFIEDMYILKGDLNFECGS
jgi:hypothetical protein